MTDGFIGLMAHPVSWIFIHVQDLPLVVMGIQCLILSCGYKTLRLRLSIVHSFQATPWLHVCQHLLFVGCCRTDREAVCSRYYSSSLRWLKLLCVHFLVPNWASDSALWSFHPFSPEYLALEASWSKIILVYLLVPCLMYSHKPTVVVKFPFLGKYRDISYN